MPDQLFSGRPAPLYEILRARERRARMQRLLTAHFCAAAVCFTVNMPGAVKLCAASETAFKAGCRALADALAEAGYTTAYFRARMYAAGPEAYCVPVPDGGVKKLKRLTVDVEQAHPLGRLFDMDCIGADGLPFGRAALSLPARTCMVCGGPAADCVSRQRHPQNEVYAAIERILRAADMGGTYAP